MLSASPSTSVVLLLCTLGAKGAHAAGAEGDVGGDLWELPVCTDHTMAVIADQRTGVIHSQVYGVTVAAPVDGFAYSMSAAFGEAAAVGGSPNKGVGTPPT